MADVYLTLGCLVFLYALMQTIGVFLEQRVPWVWMILTGIALAFFVRGWRGQEGDMSLSDLPDVFIRTIEKLFM